MSDDQPFDAPDHCRVHQTLRVTPAMEAKLTDHVWTIRDLLTAA